MDGQLFKTVDDGGAQPGATVEHTLTGLPAGDHTIFARWNIANTVNAFYQCVDVTVTGAAAADSSPRCRRAIPGDGRSTLQRRLGTAGILTTSDSRVAMSRPEVRRTGSTCFGGLKRT